MHAPIPVETESKTLQIGIGFASHQDSMWAAVRATAMARTGLHGASPDLVLLLTPAVPAQGVVPPSSGEPRASAACLEAAYSTGLGYAEGFDGRSAPASDTLIQGSVDATLTALKRLEGDGARLLLVIESTARHRALGAAAADEWAAIKGTIDSRTPCVGWLCDHVAAYGRGVRPVDAHGSLVVVALGDTPRR